MQAGTPVERLRSLLPDIFVPPQIEGELFVQLEIAPQIIVAIPLMAIAEVSLVTASEITPIPNMPDSILGLFNTKGYVFWLMDLAHFLGFDSKISQIQRYEMIMVHSGSEPDSGKSILKPGTSEQFLGLAVQHVQGSFRVSSSEIQASDTQMRNNVAPELLSYVDAYILHDQAFAPILNIARIKDELMAFSQSI